MPNKPIMILSEWWMKWLCEQLKLEYVKGMRIDTGYIIYVESQWKESELAKGRFAPRTEPGGRVIILGTND